MKAPVDKSRLYVAGKWVTEKESMPVIDKYTGETFANVPVASRETTERAIRAAHEAFPAWSRTGCRWRSPPRPISASLPPPTPGGTAASHACWE